MTDDERSRIFLIIDGLSQVSPKDDFEFLIQIVEQTGNELMFDTILEAFVSLADKQWETYEAISDRLKESLHSTLRLLWDKDSLDSTEKIIGIIGRLGLEKSFSYLLKSTDHLSNASVKHAILSAAEEFGDSVSDPYSGMR